MVIPTFHDLFLYELRDLYYAEHRLAEALPRMAKAATNKQLSKAFTQHAKETEKHAERLEQIFELLDERAKAEKCEAIDGLLEEGKEALQADMPDSIRDAALIGSAQRVEHYEIAAYGTARSFAELMGHKKVAKMLQKTLDEEGKANEKLTSLALRVINKQAYRDASGM